MKLNQKQLRSLVERLVQETNEPEVLDVVGPIVRNLEANIIDALSDPNVAQETVNMMEFNDPANAPARYEDIDHFANQIVERLMKSGYVRDALHTCAERVLRELMRSKS